MDDFTYARDNKLPFGTSAVPEPASGLLVLFGTACIAIVVAARRRRISGKIPH
jgi:hypothetical protein